MPSSAMPTTGSPRPSGTSWEVRRPGATRPVALPRAVHDVAVQYLVTRPRQTSQVLPGDQPIELDANPASADQVDRADVTRVEVDDADPARHRHGVRRGAGPDQA